MAREVWYPPEASGGRHPLILFSHFSGGDRRSSSYLCAYLAQAGYIVASIDHAERTMPRPSEAADETEKAARMQALIASRVPDMLFLLDRMLETRDAPARVDPKRIGVAGHSLGGWTALAMPSHDSRVGAVVALAPAGSRNPRPGVIPAPLEFRWSHPVPALIVAGDCDITTPLSGIRDIYERLPEPKRLEVLAGVAHLHFVDDAAAQHEAVRAMQFPPELSWINEEMRPFDELAGEKETHDRVCELTRAHFDSSL